MDITITSSIKFGFLDELRSAVKLPHDVAEIIAKPINSTDEPMLAGPLGVGDFLHGTVEHKRELIIRKDAVDALAKELAKHLIGQLESRDTINGYAIDKEDSADLS